MRLDNFLYLLPKSTNTGNVNLRVNSETYYSVRRPDGNHFGAGEFIDNNLYFIVFAGSRFVQIGQNVDNTTIGFNSDGNVGVIDAGIGHDQLADGTEGNVVSYNSTSRPVSTPLRPPTLIYYGVDQTSRIAPLRDLGVTVDDLTDVFMDFIPNGSRKPFWC